MLVCYGVVPLPHIIFHLPFFLFLLLPPSYLPSLIIFPLVLPSSHFFLPLPNSLSSLFYFHHSSSLSFLSPSFSPSIPLFLSYLTRLSLFQLHSILNFSLFSLFQQLSIPLPSFLPSSRVSSLPFISVPLLCLRGGRASHFSSGLNSSSPSEEQRWARRGFQVGY